MPYSQPDSLLNRPDSRSRRQALRFNMTEPERRLWYYLRRNQLGTRFRRQYGIGPYIADFCCPAAKLVVEVDGDSHALTRDARQADATREAFLLGAGFRVLRFGNGDVMRNLPGVLAVIKRNL